MRKCLILLLLFFNVDLHAQFVSPSRDILKGTIIDMRSKENFKKTHISGSINITIEDLKIVIQSGDFDEFHNLCVIFGVSPEKKVYIIPDNQENILNALILAGALNFIGIKEIFILKGTYKDLINTGLPETNKGIRLIYTDWIMNHPFNFLSSETYKKLQKQKSLIINLDEKLEKNKNIINIKPDMLLQNEFFKSCEEIDKLIFTGKRKEKKDIILKSEDIFTLLGMKYLLSKVCGYDNVMVFKEGGQ